MEKLFTSLNSNQEEELLAEETKLSKDIQIKNFSSIGHYKASRTYFVIDCFSPPVIFCVSVYPSGVSLQTEGYISVQFLKLFINTSDPIYIHNVLWMLSIVDNSGHSHFCQSFSNENIIGYPYNVVVSKFMKRLIIEDNADLFLPDDILTLRCELLYISKKELRNSYLEYYGRKTKWYLKYNKIYTKEVWKPPVIPIRGFDRFHDFNLMKAVLANFKFNLASTGDSIVSFCRHMDTIMEMFLKNFLNYISYMDLGDLEYQLDLYAKSTVIDEFCDGYIACNCIFQTYIVCKQIYREEFNKIPLDKNMLKPGYSFFLKWLCIPLMKMKEKYLHFPDPSLNGRIEKENHTKFSIMEERSFVEEILDTYKIQKKSESCCNGWNCIQEAFVYLLVDEDMFRVCENVLKYPVLDYRVKAVDMDCQINFLHFLHDGNIQTKSMTALCKLYEMAQKYEVRHLRYLCAQEMDSFFTKDNIDSVEKITHVEDYYLKRKINLFKNKITQNEGWFVN